MVVMTQSFEYFLMKYYRELFVPIMFGHIELLTKEMQEKYNEWCLTDEGKQYLKGGSKYNPNHKGNIALDKMLKGGADNGL